MPHPGQPESYLPVKSNLTHRLFDKSEIYNVCVNNNHNQLYLQPIEHLCATSVEVHKHSLPLLTNTFLKAWPWHKTQFQLKPWAKKFSPLLVLVFIDFWVTQVYSLILTPLYDFCQKGSPDTQ